MFLRVFLTWVKKQLRLIKNREKYHCYKCNKFKRQSKFGECSKPHVAKVRGAPINFACKKCVKQGK